jgi:hypothetical protein
MLRRLTASFTCVAVMLHLGGCTRPHTATTTPEVLGTIDYKWLVGVTTDSGEVIDFDPVPVSSSSWNARKRPRATHAEARNDTIFALVNAQPRAFALADVQHVLVTQTKIDPIATGVGVIVLAAMAVIVVSIVNSHDDDNPPQSSNSSCPLVYSWNGQQFVFDAEPFAGAVSKGLERDDFAELENLKAIDGMYRLRVANEMTESDYVNRMQLQVVDHPPGTRVAMDADGGVHTIMAPVPPLRATDADGRDLRLWLEATDRRLWEPLPEAGNTRARQELVLSFPKPAGADRVKLIANVQTGTLGARMIAEMLALRGSQLPWFYSMVDHVPAARDSLLAWNLREELFILQIEVEERGGWHVRGRLPGEALAPENIVVPLDIGGVEGDELRIRIRPPIGFWALNSFAVEYGLDQPVHIQHVLPSQAQDASGNDVLPALLDADDAYAALPKTDDWVHVDFPAPPQSNHLQRTVFLHSRGYYVLQLPTDPEPDHETLDRIATVPDAAARFARDRFLEWQARVAARRGEPK